MESKQYFLLFFASLMAVYSTHAQSIEDIRQAWGKCSNVIGIIKAEGIANMQQAATKEKHKLAFDDFRNHYQRLLGPDGKLAIQTSLQLDNNIPVYIMQQLIRMLNGNGFLFNDKLLSADNFATRLTSSFNRIVGSSANQRKEQEYLITQYKIDGDTINNVIQVLTEKTLIRITGDFLAVDNLSNSNVSPTQQETTIPKISCSQPNIEAIIRDLNLNINEGKEKELTQARHNIESIMHCSQSTSVIDNDFLNVSLHFAKARLLFRDKQYDSACHYFQMVAPLYRTLTDENRKKLEKHYSVKWDEFSSIERELSVHCSSIKNVPKNAAKQEAEADAKATDIAVLAMRRVAPSICEPEPKRSGQYGKDLVITLSYSAKCEAGISVNNSHIPLTGISTDSSVAIFQRLSYVLVEIIKENNNSNNKSITEKDISVKIIGTADSYQFQNDVKYDNINDLEGKSFGLLQTLNSIAGATQRNIKFVNDIYLNTNTMLAGFRAVRHAEIVKKAGDGWLDNVKAYAFAYKGANERDEKGTYRKIIMEITIQNFFYKDPKKYAGYTDLFFELYAAECKKHRIPFSNN
jgi:hypothetical protein